MLSHSYYFYSNGEINSSYGQHRFRHQNEFILVAGLADSEHVELAFYQPIAPIAKAYLIA